jgi:hypothetical protein
MTSPAPGPKRTLWPGCSTWSPRSSLRVTQTLPSMTVSSPGHGATVNACPPATWARCMPRADETLCCACEFIINLLKLVPQSSAICRAESNETGAAI